MRPADLAPAVVVAASHCRSQYMRAAAQYMRAAAACRRESRGTNEVLESAHLLQLQRSLLDLEEKLNRHSSEARLGYRIRGTWKASARHFDQKDSTDPGYRIPAVCLNYNRTDKSATNQAQSEHFSSALEIWQLPNYPL